MTSEVALQRKISDVIAEYEIKLLNVENAIDTFEQAGRDLNVASTISGTYSQVRIDTGSIYKRTMEESLLRSAWLHIYEGLSIKEIASAKDKKHFEQSLQDLPSFTLENIRATFGDFIIDPRGNILRGLAEVFSDLDPIFKSHDKMKIGVKGLPKRVIMRNVGGYGWGRDNLQNVLNALAQVQGKSLVTYDEIDGLLKDENALLPSRGVSLKRYTNGNGHLHFTLDTLRDINQALAEFYGDVLADCSEDENLKPQHSKAVSKDLQYYPTPQKVVDQIIDDMWIEKGSKVLEPSCGCGRFMDALREKGANVIGFEIDQSRVETCHNKGHKVIHANFLESAPKAEFDYVIMNPPFYGKHYAKHVNHALKFLKNGGILKTVLPATARYDHGLLHGEWCDLPVGSFSESGTNINTAILTIRKRGEA